MTKSTHNQTHPTNENASNQVTQPAAPEHVAPQPQPVYQQPVYYQQQPYAAQQYAPRPRPQATHPGLELSLAIIASIVSVWLFSDALTATLMITGNVTPIFGGLSTFFVDSLSGFMGVIVSALVSVCAAVAAFWLFGRTRNAVESGDYKASLQIGFGVVAAKTVILAATTLGVGLTPLLTLRDGVKRLSRRRRPGHHRGRSYGGAHLWQPSLWQQRRRHH